MDNKHTLNSNKKALLSIYILGVTLALFLSFSHWGYDDPYITYRYAHNVAHGAGFVYNPGEQILSTTTPLFTFLLASLSFLWGDLPHLANLIGALSLALGGVFIWDIAHTWRSPVVAWTGLLLYPFFPLLITTLGSETPLYLAFCLGAFAFYIRKNDNLTAIFSALAVLTRPDGALVPGLFALDFLIRGRRPIPWKAVALFLGLTLPWFIFAWAYFGSPLPATLATKQQQGVMVISQRFAPGFLSIAKSYSKRWFYQIEAGMAVIGVIYMSWRARRWALFLSWSALYFIVYAFLGVSSYFWYYAPLVPGFIISIGLGLEALTHLWSYYSKRADHHSIQANQASTILTIIILAPIFLGQVNSLWKLRQHSDPRSRFYRQVGEWIDANIPAGAKVGTLEIGIIGYYAQRYMVDFAGLLQPDVAKQLTATSTYDDAAIWAAENYTPEVLILHEGFYTHLEKYTNQYCELIQSFSGSPYGSEQILHVYTCKHN